MTERLREVADEPAAFGVVLLGEQADVIAQTEEAIEQRARFVVTARERVIVSASQNVHIKKAPSPGGRPSTELAVIV